MDMSKLHLTDDPQFARVGRHGAIINIDTKAYEQYKKNRTESLAVKQLSVDVANLQRDIGEIKDLLRRLVSND